MIKRILMLMMVFTILLTLPARSENFYEQIDNALYRIVLRTDAGDITVGSGALFVSETTILTAAGRHPEGALYAIGTDGEHAVKSVFDLGSGALLLELAEPSKGKPLTLAPDNVQSLPYVFGVNAAGERGTMPLYKARADRQGDTPALLFSSEEGLLPGAFLTDQTGQLTALIIAQQMEGKGSYIGLGLNALERLFSETTPDDRLLDCSFAWEDGQMIISWTDEEHTEGVYVITLVSPSNQYYTTYVEDISKRSITLTPPPGHLYTVQVQRAPSEAEALPLQWDYVKNYSLPLLPYRAHNFKSECCVIGIPAGFTYTGEEAPMTAFSSMSLTASDRDILLRVDCSYDIPESTDAVLALELICPDGQFFFDERIIRLDPAKSAADSFALPLDRMLNSCKDFSGGTIPEGSYTVRFFLEGCKAGEYTFTVEAEADCSLLTPYGFATKLQATEGLDLITINWDNITIPENAKVRVYCLYEGNPYHVYVDVDRDTTSTQFFTVPDHSMIAWVAWTRGEEFPNNPPSAQSVDQYIRVRARSATPFFLYQFQNQRIGLAPSADPDAGMKTEFLPQPVITREILSDRSTPLYFMTEDTYEVSELSEDHPLLIALFTPEGMCFIDMGYYIFDPSLKTSDLWLKDISQIFADYESFTGDEAWPAGKYSLLYCIDGDIAGEFTFTLD